MNNVLFDTNILIYSHDTTSPYFEKSTQAIQNSLRCDRVFLSTQNYIEAYRIWTQKITRPITTKQAWQIIIYYQNHSAINTIYPHVKVMNKLRELTEKYSIRGVQVFDAQIVATMIYYKVSTIYTANSKDFEVFKEIKVINPIK